MNWPTKNSPSVGHLDIVCCLSDAVPRIGYNTVTSYKHAGAITSKLALDHQKTNNYEDSMRYYISLIDARDFEGFDRYLHKHIRPVVCLQSRPPPPIREKTARGLWTSLQRNLFMSDNSTNHILTLWVP